MRGPGPTPNDAGVATIAVYEEFGPAMLRYAGQSAASADEARDAVQEVFLRYFVEQRHGRVIDNPRAWLYQVLRNYILDCAKAAPSQREIPTADLESLGAQQQDNPEELVQRSQAAREIAQALSNREFTCLALRGEGLSYSEIAQVMDICTGTVGALLSRAQIKLRLYGRRQEKRNFQRMAEALLSLLQTELRSPVS